MFADVLSSGSEVDSDLSTNDDHENQRRDQLEETSEYTTCFISLQHLVTNELNQIKN